MAITKEFATGEQLLATEINDIKKKLLVLVTAGETINGATLPVPVGNLDSDNEWYACDANDTARLQFRGFAITNGTNGNTFYVQTEGIVTGFSGLTPGARYYVQDSVGTIGSTAGTYVVPVGIAISATEILIIKKLGIDAGSVSDLSTTSAANNDVTVSCGFRPRLIILNIWIQGHDSTAASNSYYAAKSTAYFLGTTNVGGITIIGENVISGDNGNWGSTIIVPNGVGATLAVGTAGSGDGDISVTISINSISDTGFVIRRLTATGTGTTGNTARAKINYIAYE